MSDPLPYQGPLDPEVVRAIREATDQAGQPTVVAERLVNWLAEASLGRTDFGNAREAEQYFSAIRQALAHDDQVGDPNAS